MLDQSIRELLEDGFARGGAGGFGDSVDDGFAGRFELFGEGSEVGGGFGAPLGDFGRIVVEGADDESSHASLEGAAGAANENALLTAIVGFDDTVVGGNPMGTGGASGSDAVGAAMGGDFGVGGAHGGPLVLRTHNNHEMEGPPRTIEGVGVGGAATRGARDGMGVDVGSETEAAATLGISNDSAAGWGSYGSREGVDVGSFGVHAGDGPGAGDGATVGGYGLADDGCAASAAVEGPAGRGGIVVEEHFGAGGDGGSEASDDTCGSRAQCVSLGNRRSINIGSQAS